MGNRSKLGEGPGLEPRGRCWNLGLGLELRQNSTGRSRQASRNRSSNAGWFFSIDQFDKQSGEEWMKVLLMSEVRTGVQAGVTDYTEI